MQCKYCNDRHCVIDIDVLTYDLIDMSL